jgi:hypothetical protein
VAGAFSGIPTAITAAGGLAQTGLLSLGLLVSLILAVRAGRGRLVPDDSPMLRSVLLVWTLDRPG